MDLWVRSQNKYRLLKVESLQIIYNQEDNELPYSINSSYELLGSYKTKERALEILDEIQQMLKNETIETEIKYIDNQVYETKIIGKPDILKNIVVYQMPK
jgi:hypothetical protein